MRARARACVSQGPPPHPPRRLIRELCTWGDLLYVHESEPDFDHLDALLGEPCAVSCEWLCRPTRRRSMSGACWTGTRMRLSDACQFSSFFFPSRLPVLDPAAAE